MLASGRGFCKKHENAAWYWLESAAKAGHAQAQFDLALRYLLGVNGVRKSITNAKVFFEAAAKQDNHEAIYYLGYMHSNGIGFAQDDEEAAKYLMRSSNLGNLRAKCALAFMYSHGLGVEKDMERSFRLYHESADGGHLGAQFGLACLYLMTGKNKDAQVWLSLAAHNDITPAQAVYAKYLVDGPEPYRDKSQALKWCLVVKETPDPDSDSLIVVSTLASRLENELSDYQRARASYLAQEWLAHRTTPPEIFERDWNLQIKSEMQFYEDKRKRRRAL